MLAMVFFLGHGCGLGPLSEESSMHVCADHLSRSRLDTLVSCVRIVKGHLLGSLAIAYLRDAICMHLEFHAAQGT